MESLQAILLTAYLNLKYPKAAIPIQPKAKG